MSELTTDDLKITDNIIIDLYGPVNGVMQLSGKLVGRTTSEAMFGTDAPSDHVNIYRVLPTAVKETIEDDWESYPYLVIKLEDDSIVYVGIPWIVPGTIILNKIMRATIVLSEFRETDLEPLKTLLRSRAYVLESATLSES